MTWLRNLDLIRFFEFYLTVIFLVSTALRVRFYLAVLALLRAMPGRWPRLLKVISQHHAVFTTWETIFPTLVTLLVLGVYELACHVVWPEAQLTVAGLLRLWPAVPVVVVLGAAMTAFDVYTCARVGKIDRPMVEKYFDQAEYWLRPWAVQVVRAVTFGYVDPRRMVATEVQKALHEMNKMLLTTLWWVSLQAGLRIAYGLAVWLTFAWSVGWGV